MRHSIRRAAALALLALPLAAQAPAGPTLPTIDAIFAGQAADAPGCAVGVRQGGRVVHRAGYGLADLEHRVAITPASVFYTGSLSKQFTATAIALLAREGRIDLDAPARRWVPELPEVAGDVSIRQFIHHTGGLREKWDLLAMQGVPVATTLITQQMVLDLVSRQRGVNFPAGTRYAYNNTGYDLLATIVARATGSSIRAFAQERIFGPLGMATARYADRYGELIPDRAMGYALRDSQWTMLPAMVETVGSGSVYASLDDLLAWVASWEGGVLGDTALQRQLETPGVLSDGRPMTYAWGLVVDEWRGERRVSHTGALAGYRTAIWRLPNQRWAAVVLCNSAEAQPERVVAQVAQATLGRLLATELTVASNSGGDVSITIPPPPEIPADIVGTYWSDELQVTWTITRRDDGYWLSRGTVPEVRATAPAVPDFPAGTPPGGELRIGGWRLTMLRDASGGITGFEVGAGRSSGVRFDRR